MSAKEEVKKKGTQNSTVSKKPIKKVEETDEMVLAIFMNAAKEMERRQLAQIINTVGYTAVVVKICG